MDLSFTEEQEILRAQARKFLANECTQAFVMKMWGEEKGYTADLWNKIAELGWLALRIPEEYDGVGLDFVDLAILFEEIGRAALPGPFLSTVLAAEALIDAGSPEQKKSWLPRIACGKAIGTLAVGEENFRDCASDIRLSATRDGADFVLDGTKLFVLDAHVADFILLAARTRASAVPEEGISIFLVRRDAPGVSTRLLKSLDGGRKQCAVVLDHLRVPASNVLGAVDRGWDILRNIYNKAAVLLAMEGVGGGQKLLDFAVDYAKIRVQFGQPIGSYQAVKHMCATIMQEVEGAKSVAYYAAWAVDQGGREADIACSTAKVYGCEMYRKAANDTHQIFGAIAFTWEHPVHLYMKRAKMNELYFGSPSFHRERLAALMGY